MAINSNNYIITIISITFLGMIGLALVGGPGATRL